MNDSPFQEILDDTAALLRASAHPRTGNIALAPETADLIDALGNATETAPPPEQINEAVAPYSSASETEAAGTASPSSPLEALAAEVAACTQCGLCDGRTQTVFADGSPTADLVFVGEAPGENEDKQGIPFVGRAGQLLTDIIVKGMKLQREDIYICNVIKCRPPNNRDPKPEEKAACEPFLLRQLDLVQPKVICALGGHAAKTLLKTEESTGSLRGKWHSYHGIPLRVTYHPAYLLRSPSEKRKTWEDVQEIMKVLNGETSPQTESDR